MTDQLPEMPPDDTLPEDWQPVLRYYMKRCCLSELMFRQLAGAQLDAMAAVTQRIDRGDIEGARRLTRELADSARLATVELNTRPSYSGTLEA